MKFLKALWVPALAIVSFSNASATTLSYLGGDATKGQNIDLLVDGNAKNYFAGLANIIIDGLQVQGAFCVDIDSFINTGVLYQVTTTDPSSLSNGGRAAWLLQNMLGTVTSTAQYAALQLAVWDIVEDGGNGLTTGRIQKAGTTDAAVVTAANGFLTASLGQSSNSGVVYLNVAGAGASQTLMVPGSVPEPATLGLTGLALVAVGLGLRRRS